MGWKTMNKMKSHLPLFSNPQAVLLRYIPRNQTRANPTTTTTLSHRSPILLIVNPPTFSQLPLKLSPIMNRTNDLPPNSHPPPSRHRPLQNTRRHYRANSRPRPPLRSPISLPSICYRTSWPLRRKPRRLARCPWRWPMVPLPRPTIAISLLSTRSSRGATPP